VYIVTRERRKYETKARNSLKSTKDDNEKESGSRDMKRIARNKNDERCKPQNRRLRTKHKEKPRYVRWNERDKSYTRVGRIKNAIR